MEDRVRSFRKTVLINRAVPGSGKTTISRKISEYLRVNGKRVSVRSTDEYFLTPDGRYDFRPELLAGFHEKNLLAFQQDLQEEVDVVACDNTNLCSWECAPYSALARRHGYQIILLTFAPRELEKHLAAQIVTPDKPDAHQVTETTLREMILEYHEFSALLDRTKPVDPERFPNRYFDPVAQQVIKTEGALPPYDYDYMIEILPDQYKQAQETLGARLWEWMNPSTV